MLKIDISPGVSKGAQGALQGQGCMYADQHGVLKQRLAPFVASLITLAQGPYHFNSPQGLGVF